ncbi:MAG: hypothetical protein CVU45_02505 [Chloroflexi bacterium HGW-Chloroflexi-7]|nr:MAG: hypothetical protein CVU45_02505 [Chloroflexi bacterium HGW-Chloroflexi-7]
MTGWAVTKRLIQEKNKKKTIQKLVVILGTFVAALLTTSATIIIFEERFSEGAWAYLLFIPVLYLVFTYFRKRIGAPTPEMDYLGHINSNLLAGFGFGQANGNVNEVENGDTLPSKLVWRPDPVLEQHRLKKNVEIHHIATLLDGSDYAAQAIPMTHFFSETLNSQVTLCSASKEYQTDHEKKENIENYLCSVGEEIHASGIQVAIKVSSSSPVEFTHLLVNQQNVDLVILTTRGGSGEKNWLSEGLSSKLVHKLDIPILLVQVYESGPPEAPHIGRILVALDGSAFAEQTLPYARLLARKFDCELMLVCVPAVPGSQNYRAPASVIKTIRKQAESSMRNYVNSVAAQLREEGLSVRTTVTGSYPARTIVDVGKREGVDLIMLTSQGRGGLDLLFMGSVAQQVVQLTDSPVFIIPINKELEK